MLRYAPQRAREQILQQHHEFQLLLDESRFSLFRDDEPDEENNESDSDEDTAETTDSEVHGAETSLQRLPFLVQCLFDLGDALDDPAQDPEYLDKPGLAGPSISIGPHQAYTQKIRDRFPSAPIDVVEYLGGENFKRYQRIIKRITDEEAAHSAELFEDEATTGIRKRTAEPKDSALGSSIPTAKSQSQSAPSEATSALSVMEEEAWRYFPELTKDAKLGEPFHCDACGRIVRITRTKHWK